MWDIDNIPDIIGEDKELLVDWLDMEFNGKKYYKIFKTRFRDLFIQQLRKKLETANESDVVALQGAIREIRKLFVDIEGLKNEVKRDNKNIDD